MINEVLAPNDDTSAAIRLVFADMTNPYDKYYTTGQDASNVALASLMGDPVRGNGTQTMTVFKDTNKLSIDSVKIAKNVIDGNDGLKGLTGGPKIDGADTAYTEIDVLLAQLHKRFMTQFLLQVIKTKLKQHLRILIFQNINKIFEVIRLF